MNAFKQFYYHARNKLRGKQPSYAINFSTKYFIDKLRTDYFVAQIFDAPLSKATSEEALQAVVRYFRERTTPITFLMPDKVSALVTGITSQYPAWKNRLLQQVRRETVDGLKVYGLESGPLGQNFSWAGPQDTPGADLQYRKRPHRFGFLPRLALASLYEPDMARHIKTVLLSWMQFVEARQGSRLAYDSNLAVIQRLMASVWAWIYLRSASTKTDSRFYELEILLLKIIFTDIQFLSTRLGKSYANNHLLADYFAGWFICKIFPEFAGVTYLNQNFEQLWIDELLRQTYEDGCSFEQSAHYHEFACDMGLSYLLLCQRNQWRVPAAVEKRIRKMLRFQAEIGGVSGVALRLGDCIEENFFPLGVHQGLGPALYREVYRGLFDPQFEPADISRPEVESAHWLLGGLAQSRCRSTPKMGITSFKAGGVYLVKDTQTEMELIFRTGPAPDTTLCAGHAHADWLTVYLSVEGKPVIVDAGTYTYRADPAKWPAKAPQWRQYFRGPESHNGVVISGEDPLGDTAQTDFRPRHITARVQTQVYANTPVADWLGGSFCQVAAFEGYARGIVCIPGNYFVIYDDHPRDFTLDWAGMQFAPNTVMSRTSDSRGLKLKGLDIVTSTGFRQLEVLCGSTEPLAGWVSESYGELRPAPQARFEFDGNIKHTAFLLARNGVDDWVLETNQTASAKIFRITHGSVLDRLILSTRLKPKAIRYEELMFEARLLWIRSIDGRISELRATDVNEVVLADQLSVACFETERWMSLSLSGGDVRVQTASGKAVCIELN